MNSPSTPKIRVLIVDDSTFVRRALIRVLSEHDDIEIVGEARDGMHAVECARKLQPDVMTLDVQMPQLNGLDVIRVLREELPTRIIMVSSFTREGAEETFKALEEGAFDFIDKTLVQNRMDFVRLGEELTEKIRLAAVGGSPAPVPKPSQTVQPPVADDAQPPQWIPHPDALIVVGSSTGGPPAVRRFFSVFRPVLKATFVVVQHMPPGFSSGFAKRLNQVSPMLVSELIDGERLTSAHVYVVPSGLEVEFEQHDEHVVARLREGVTDKRHRPSLDHTLRSAAAIDLPLKLGVVLTGMGTDGQEGAVAFTESGGKMAVQDKDSCIIYGMPKAVLEKVPDAYVGPPESLGEFVMKQIEESIT